MAENKSMASGRQGRRVEKFGGYVTVLVLIVAMITRLYICQNSKLQIKDEFLLYINYTSVNLTKKKKNTNI